VPSFTVTAAGQKIQLDSKGAGQAQYTVTNASPNELKGRLIATPQDPAKAEWFSIDGEATRDFAPGAAEQVLLKMAVPAGTPPATYSVRLDAVSEVAPDEDFTEGPSVSFDVTLPPPPVPWWKKYWWIFVIIGVVLLAAIGVAVWLLTKGNGSATPTTTPTTTTSPTTTTGPTPAGPGFDTSRLSVVNGDSRTASAGSPAFLQASCPAGQFAFSGGYSSSDSWLAEHDASISTTTWRAALINPAGASKTQQIVLLCYDAPSGFDSSALSVVSGASHSVAAGSNAFLDTSCPAGQVVLSGGYNSGYAWQAELDAPISTDTWRVGLRNTSGGTQSVQTELLCYAPPAGFDTSKLNTVPGPSHDVAPGSSSTADASCPGGQHVLSGGYNTGYFWQVQNDAPVSTTGWRVGLTNPNGGTQSFAVTLLCYAG
jgi:hypothetical protein